MYASIISGTPSILPPGTSRRQPGDVLSSVVLSPVTKIRGGSRRMKPNLEAVIQYREAQVPGVVSSCRARLSAEIPHLRASPTRLRAPHDT